MYLYWVMPILLLAGLIDLFRHKIPNLITYSLFICGIAFSFHSIGFSCAIDLLINSFICVLIFGYGFKQEVFGGGDFKLILAIGTILTIRQYLSFLFYTVVIGAVWGIVAIIIELIKVIHREKISLHTLNVNVILDIYKRTDKKYIPYGVCIACGYALLLFLIL